MSLDVYIADLFYRPTPLLLTDAMSQSIHVWVFVIFHAPKCNKRNTNVALYGNRIIT